MANQIECDVWVRGTLHATTHTISNVPERAGEWTDSDVHRLLSEMLLALEREKNPAGDRPPVTLRGFSWIVSPYDRGGVLVHLEMQMGTASAGPIALEADQLSAAIERVLKIPAASSSVH